MRVLSWPFGDDILFLAVLVPGSGSSGIILSCEYLVGVKFLILSAATAAAVAALKSDA